jgi:uncharacterized sporulation protein YeaH/YhbH (DUF444 family)
VAENGTDAVWVKNLWRDYATFNQSSIPKGARPIAMRKIHDRAQIFPVFAELFKKKPKVRS